MASPAPSPVWLLHQCTDLDEPRLDRSKRHRLLDIVAVTLCAVVSGADAGEEKGTAFAPRSLGKGEAM
jgi:hypothetical protein